MPDCDSAELWLSPWPAWLQDGVFAGQRLSVDAPGWDGFRSVCPGRGYVRACGGPAGPCRSRPSCGPERGVYALVGHGLAVVQALGVDAGPPPREPGPPPREPAPRAPWPDWLEWKPSRVWAYDFTHWTRAQRASIAILDVVSRKWPPAHSVGSGLDRDPVRARQGRVAAPEEDPRLRRARRRTRPRPGRVQRGEAARLDRLRHPRRRTPRPR